MKARRGELVVAAPVGFIKVGDRLEKDRPARSGGYRTRHREGGGTGQRTAGLTLVSGAQAGPADPDQRRSGGVKPSRYSTLREFIANPAYGRLRLWADRRDRALWRSRSQVRCAASLGQTGWR